MPSESPSDGICFPKHPAPFSSCRKQIPIRFVANAQKNRCRLKSQTGFRRHLSRMKTENTHIVIPAKAVAQGGLQPSDSRHLHPKIPSFPRRRESRLVGLQPFPINSCCFSFLDSHFVGMTAVGVSVISDKSPPFPVIPAKVGIRFFELQPLPINCFNVAFPNSRFRGNDAILGFCF